METDCRSHWRKRRRLLCSQNLFGVVGSFLSAERREMLEKRQVFNRYMFVRLNWLWHHPMIIVIGYCYHFHSHICMHICVCFFQKSMDPQKRKESLQKAHQFRAWLKIIGPQIAGRFTTMVPTGGFFNSVPQPNHKLRVARSYGHLNLIHQSYPIGSMYMEYLPTWKLIKINHSCR